MGCLRTSPVGYVSVQGLTQVPVLLVWTLLEQGPTTAQVPSGPLAASVIAATGACSCPGAALVELSVCSMACGWARGPSGSFGKKVVGLFVIAVPCYNKFPQV